MVVQERLFCTFDNSDADLAWAILHMREGHWVGRSAGALSAQPAFGAVPFGQRAPAIFRLNASKIAGKNSRQSLRANCRFARIDFSCHRDRAKGAHVGMLAGLRAAGVRTVFDQSAGEEDHDTTLSILASATCMLLLGRMISRRSALLARPEQACAGPSARLTRRLMMILVFMMVIAPCARAEDACIDPSTLAATTVSITRYFTANEKPRPSLDGYRATAWFYRSTRYLVSIAHFVDDPPVLPRGEWRNIDVRQRDVTVEVSARLLAVVRALPEGLALFELREPFPNARTLKLRERPLSRNEPVRSIAYLDGLRFAKGRFAEIAGSGDIPLR